MAKYYISVTETLNRVVCVEAESLDDAIYTAEQAYYDEEVVLDASDYVATEFSDASEEVKTRIDDEKISEEDFQLVPASK